MKIWRTLEAVAEDPLPAPYVTVGAFDGVHLGHRAVLAELKEMARLGRGSAVVVTFEDHPAAARGEGPGALNYFPERLARLAAAGADATLVLDFDDRLRRMSADQFVEEHLVAALHARGVCVGHDHHFGHDGRGDISLLSWLGKKHQFETRAVAPFAVEGMIVSSTLIRRKLRDGDVAAANKYLGYRYEVTGIVEAGRGVGAAELGYPTANVRWEPKMTPAPGVYAALVQLRNGAGSRDEGPFGAFLNLGFRPTFETEAAAPLLEVHLFDFAGELLGANVVVQFVARLRDEIKFQDAAALRRQLELDEEKARRILFHH